MAQKYTKKDTHKLWVSFFFTKALFFYYFFTKRKVALPQRSR
jgi:hypothetical protein